MVIALHVALIAAFSLGASTGKAPRHARAGAADARLVLSAEDFHSTIIFIDPEVLSRDEGVVSSGQPLRPLKAKDLLLPRLVRLTAPTSDLASSGVGDSDAARATSTAEVDGAAQALLFGRYVDQITARIERLWIRPQTSPGGLDEWPSARQVNARGTGAFQCRVQIVQAADGRVLEVTLASCDSSPEWQQSLVNAIDAASPLPAPPNRSVFARSLVLNFTSAAPTPAAAR